MHASLLRTKSLFLLCAGTMAVILTGCLPDAAAEKAQLEKACIAAIQAISPKDDIFEPQRTTMTGGKTFEGLKMQTLDIAARHTENRGLIHDVSFSCSFEGRGFLPKKDYYFYRLTFDNRKYGSFDGKLEGSVEDLLKINNAVDGVLG